MSLWWRWLAVEGIGEKVPRLWAGEELEQELGQQSGLELGSRLGQEKQEQQCGLQRCFGFHHHLHWLPEEAAGLMWLSVSEKRIQHRGNSHEPFTQRNGLFKRKVMINYVIMVERSSYCQ